MHKILHRKPCLLAMLALYLFLQGCDQIKLKHGIWMVAQFLGFLDEQKIQRQWNGL
jgi:hypothetical protein